MQPFLVVLRYRGDYRGVIRTYRYSITMKNKKGRIDTYETIYYVDIIVANQYVTLEELKDLYVYADNVELDDSILDGDATTSMVLRKEDDKYCILVKYNHPNKCKSIDKNIDFINTISHEAGHVVMDMYDYIHQNICTCSQEPFCYLLGYATECIYKTLKNK